MIHRTQLGKLQLIARHDFANDQLYYEKIIQSKMEENKNIHCITLITPKYLKNAPTALNDPIDAQGQTIVTQSNTK